MIRIEGFSLVMLDSGQVRIFEEVATAWVAALPAASEDVHLHWADQRKTWRERSWEMD